MSHLSSLCRLQVFVGSPEGPPLIGYFRVQVKVGLLGDGSANLLPGSLYRRRDTSRYQRTNHV